MAVRNGLRDRANREITGSMTVGHVLRTAFLLWFRNLPRFLLLTAVCFVPIVGWYLLLRIPAVSRAVFAYVEVPLAKLHPVLEGQAASGRWIVFALLGAAIATCTVARLRGERASIWRGLASAVRRAPWLVGTALIVRLATTGVITAIQIAQWDPEDRFRTPSLTSIIAHDALWVALASLFLAAIPAAVIERRGVLSAIARGFTLARGARIRVLAALLVYQALMAGIYYLLYRLVLVPAFTEYGFSSWRYELYAWLQFGIQVVFAALAPILAAVIYERLRAAKEGPSEGELDRVFA